MRRIFLVIGVVVLLFGSICEAKKRGRSSKQFWGRSENTDEVYIDEDDGPSGDGDLEAITDHTHVDEEGGDDDVQFSGDDSKKDGEDDSIELSGSGMGEPEESTKAPMKPTTTTEKSTMKALTPCKQLEKSAKGLTNYIGFVPNCTKEGKFRKLQCLGESKLKECWCVDHQGIEISGTRMTQDEPDCDLGLNLKSCIFQKVQSSQGLMGAFMPNCTASGEYTPLQCHEAQCWCVNKLGTQLPGSVRNVWEARPNCEGEKITPGKTVKPTEVVKPFIKPGQDPKKTDDGYVLPTEESDSSEEVDNVIVKTDNKIPIDDPEEEEEETNTIEDEVDNGVYAEQNKAATTAVLAQPGILAAVIGGAVVGLLCMVLLVMFVVYRVRKKDEGSYPLDDKNYQNYSYAKAPDKEFYA